MSKEKPDKDDLLAWMSPTSNDFLGSGMTMREWSIARSIAEFQDAWCNQEPKEKKRRFHFIILLTLERDRIHHEYGTEHEGTWYVQSGIGMESCIKSLIAGDLKELKESSKMYEEEFWTWNLGDQGAIWAERFAPFVKICNDCIDTWPNGKESIRA
jgi:hypothetical protein